MASAYCLSYKDDGGCCFSCLLVMNLEGLQLLGVVFAGTNEGWLAERQGVISLV